MGQNGKDLDTVLAFTKMRAEPMVFDLPVLVSYSKMGRICCCNVESSLVVFEHMTDEGCTIAGDSEGGSNFLEDVAKRNKSAHSGSKGRVFCFHS